MNLNFLDRFSKKSTKYQVLSKYDQWESSFSMRINGHDEANSLLSQFREHT
jgi:uncharacterized protein YozE (UPF0346 family)